MYALVNDRGKQYKMVPGETVEIDRIESEPGIELTFENVLILRTDDGLKMGTPYIEGATVVAELVEDFKGPKIYIGKFKRRKNYRRRTGHRQPLTRIMIKEIQS